MWDCHGEVVETFGILPEKIRNRETVDYLKNKYSSKPLQIPLTPIISACRLIESNTVVKVCLAGISLLYISKPEKGELCMAEIISICVLQRE